jgi:hypothetical protein
VFATFQAMRPFFDYMSEILTTDLNGEPLWTTLLELRNWNFVIPTT